MGGPREGAGLLEPSWSSVCVTLPGGHVTFSDLSESPEMRVRQSFRTQIWQVGP